MTQQQSGVIENTLKSKRAELASETVSRDLIAVERMPEAIDDVQQSANRELAIASLNLNWKTIRAIDEALERLEDGSYGICADCEEPISERRLKAIPWASLCVRCQEAHDRRGAPGSMLEWAA